MKILLFGRNGQVGWELQRALAPLGEVIALDRASTLPGDLAQPEALRGTVRRVAPDAIVNAAAYTAVDRAEAEPELAHTVNAVAPRVLAEEAATLGAWLVHYSSDYVFDGSGNAPWREDSPTEPLNTYGRTKLAGEAAIRAGCPRHVILRTSWVYAARGSNFAKTMLRLAGERETLSVVDDQFGAPTGAELIADATAHVLRALVERPALAGTYHIAAAGETSWHGYARHVIELAASLKAPIKARSETITAVPSTAFATAARRPANSRLATAKLCETFGLVMPPWQAGVTRLMQEVLAA